MGYKYCMVPRCTNTTTKTPHKIFVSVPSDSQIRKKWLQAARRNPDKISSTSKLYTCEDHFNVEEDWANWMKFKMGYTQKIILTPGCLPSRFDCQENERKNLDGGLIQIPKRELSPEIETHFQVVKAEYIEPEIMDDDPLRSVEADIMQHKPTEIKKKLKKTEISPDIVIKDEPLPEIVQNNKKDEILHDEGFKLFKCMFCSKYFTCRSMLTKHEETHAAVNPYKCHFCNKCFSQYNIFTVHIRNHTGEIVNCKICNKSFTSYIGLKRHERIHKDEKQLKCQFCSKPFTDKSGLTRHERIHTGERPFKCHLCKKSFSRNFELTRHKRSHEGKKHKDEKQFKCQFCSKPFTDKSGLTSHERIHTGEKPFKCHSCDKCFTRQNTLQAHERSHVPTDIDKKHFKPIVSFLD